jgi:hypothetical protein
MGILKESTNILSKIKFLAFLWYTLQPLKKRTAGLEFTLFSTANPALSFYNILIANTRLGFTLFSLYLPKVNPVLSLSIILIANARLGFTLFLLYVPLGLNLLWP